MCVCLFVCVCVFHKHTLICFVCVYVQTSFCQATNTHVHMRAHTRMHTLSLSLSVCLSVCLSFSSSSSSFFSFSFVSLTDSPSLRVFLLLFFFYQALPPRPFSFTLPPSLVPFPPCVVILMKLIMTMTCVFRIFLAGLWTYMLMSVNVLAISTMLKMNMMLIVCSLDLD